MQNFRTQAKVKPFLEKNNNGRKEKDTNAINSGHHILLAMPKAHAIYCVIVLVLARRTRQEKTSNGSKKYLMLITCMFNENR